MSDRDWSNGYEQIAPIFLSVRGQNNSGVGARVVAEWSRLLPDDAAVLDIGCGNGIPISKALIDRGIDVYGVDAAPTMVAAFQEHFPSNPVQCAAVEHSDFFHRKFDGVVAWGLFFLLDAEVQRTLIRKVASILPRGGRLLFTAPFDICSWPDAMTDQLSVSLGFDEYKRVLEANGMLVVATHHDEGDNYYYSAQRT